MRLSGSETVLAVDDDPIMLELVKELLTPLGYRFSLQPAVRRHLK